MAQKRKSSSSHSIGKTIFNIILLIPTFYSLVGKVFALIGHEARLAGKSIIQILLLAVASAVILATTWLCILALIGVYLASLGLSYALIFGIFILLNLTILGILMTFARKAEKNLRFSATRHHIHRAFRNSHE